MSNMPELSFDICQAQDSTVTPLDVIVDWVKRYTEQDPVTDPGRSGRICVFRSKSIWSPDWDEELICAIPVQTVYTNTQHALDQFIFDAAYKTAPKDNTWKWRLFDVHDHHKRFINQAGEYCCVSVILDI